MRAGGAALMGRASLPDGPKDGWKDGGDIRLEPEPLLCAGRVVDARGAPVAAAGVVVDEEQRWFGGGTVTGTCDAELFFGATCVRVLDVPGVQVFTLELAAAALAGVVAGVGW